MFEKTLLYLYWYSFLISAYFWLSNCQCNALLVQPTHPIQTLPVSFTLDCFIDETWSDF